MSFVEHLHTDFKMYMIIGTWSVRMNYINNYGRITEERKYVLTKYYCYAKNKFLWRSNTHSSCMTGIKMSDKLTIDEVLDNGFTLHRLMIEDIFTEKIMHVLPSKWGADFTGYYTFAHPNHLKPELTSDMFMRYDEFISYMNTTGNTEAEHFQNMTNIKTITKNLKAVTKSLNACVKDAKFAAQEVPQLTQKIQDVEYVQQMFVEKLSHIGEKLAETMKELKSLIGLVDNNDTKLVELADLVDTFGTDLVAIAERVDDADYDILKDIQSLLEERPKVLCNISNNTDAIKQTEDSLYNIEKLLMNVTQDVNDMRADTIGAYKDRAALETEIANNIVVQNQVAKMKTHLSNIMRDVAYLKSISPMIQL